MGKFSQERITNLKPAFSPDGSITAASSSKLSDGAAVLFLASKQFCQNHQLTPIAFIHGYAECTQEKEKFGLSPELAIRKCLMKAGNIGIEQIDLFEINEAFSVVALANIKRLLISKDICNVLGGAVAIGHPLGASGARIICTLLTALSHFQKKTGIASICHGGGGATAILVLINI